MDGGDTVVIDAAIFDRNLAALREVDPPLADVLSSLKIPDTVTPCRGRDDTTTFRIRADDGREHWFGGTSAPTVTAPSLLSAFDAGSGNVMLFGIGHGAEVVLLLRRIEHHRGVIVLENDPALMSLALRLHDYERAIREMRLALILGSSTETETRLGEFLSRHDGFCCPERLLVWPWQTKGDVQTLQLAVERAVAASNRLRATALAEIHGRWPKEPAVAGPATPRVAVVARMATPTARQWAQDAADGGRELGWTTEAFTVYGPTDCHVLSLARELEAFRPDWVLAIRATRAGLSAAVAPGVPIVSWVDPIGGANASCGGWGAGDSLAVTSAGVRDRIAPERRPPRPPVVVPHAGPAVLPQATEEGDRPYDVAIMLDVAPADPRDCGINLHTQQVLWRETAGVIRGELDSFTRERSEVVLAAAEDRARVAIREPDLRVPFVQLIAESVGPTTIATELARQLAVAGLDVHVWGSGWATHAIAGVHHHGPIPEPLDARVTLSKTKCYVCPSIDGEVGRDVVEAAGAGAVVAWRTHPADRDEGGMQTLFAEGAEFAAFRTAGDLVRCCQRLLGDAGGRDRIRRAAVERLDREHTMRSRLGAFCSLARRTS